MHGFILAYSLKHIAAEKDATVDRGISFLRLSDMFLCYDGYRDLLVKISSEDSPIQIETFWLTHAQ